MYEQEQEKELARATHEAALYKEGFRAAQKAYESAPKPTSYPSPVAKMYKNVEPPVYQTAAGLDDTHTGVSGDERVRSEEEAHAQV